MKRIALLDLSVASKFRMSCKFNKLGNHGKPLEHDKEIFLKHNDIKTMVMPGQETNTVYHKMERK